MYSVTFKNQAGEETLSRYFETVKAARKWAGWLRDQRFVSAVSLYRGQPGEELLEGRGIPCKGVHDAVSARQAAGEIWSEALVHENID
jgi:hypothetical protein